MSAKCTFLHQATEVDPDAIKQLKFAASQPGMISCIGMPDLHPGGKYPVGASFIATTVYPELVGQDIGCGMSLYELDCSADLTERQMEKMCKALRRSGLEDGSASQPVVNGPAEAKKGISKLINQHQSSYGTVGGGNHFAEFQIVERIQEEAVVDASRLHLLIHSGSRTLGEDVLKSFRRDNTGKPGGNVPGALETYLTMHDVAVSWARQNREEIARRAADACRVRIRRKILDICHNSVTTQPDGDLFIHRKGAAPTDCGLVAIPGSRGTMTYIVRPTSDEAAQESAGWSVAHGAGRVIGRKDLQRKLDKRYPSKEACEKALAATALGGKVVYNDEKILRQEAPEAYKDIEAVVGDLVARDLVAVAAIMRPVITCKL